MLRSFSQARIRKKRVILRVDFNVPIRGRRVLGDFRIRAVLPTIRKLRAAGNTIAILSHHSDRRQTLRPVAVRLGRLLGEPVAFVADPARFRPPAPRFSGGKVFLVENLRFWRGEERMDSAFARLLARLGEIFINDAFGVAHRRAASTEGLARLLPGYLGLCFERELHALDRVRRKPVRPDVVIIGGAKLETNLRLLKRSLRLADHVLVGGAIAAELLAGHAHLARSRKLLLPIDGPLRGGRLADIGPKSIRRFTSVIRLARTIVWNGPLGIAEAARYAKGTGAISRALARARGSVVVGGGDTVAFLERVGLTGAFDHVSTGGGAMIAFLAGEKLSALEALKRSGGRLAS